MEKSFVKIDAKIELAYQWVEPKKKFTDVILVFLHEAIGSIGQWKKFPQLLCDALGAEGLVYEREGYGDSSPLTKKRTNSYLEDYALVEMPQIVQQLLPTKKLTLIGHSDGGTIALLYAAKYPKNIHAVVSIAPHVLVEQKTIDGFQPILQLFKKGRFEGLKKYHGDKMNDVFHAWYDTWNHPDYLQWNITEKIHQDLPTLIIQGDQDEYATEKHPYLIKDKLSNCTVVFIKNCKHQPQLEKPEETVEIIKKYFSVDV